MHRKSPGLDSGRQKRWPESPPPAVAPEDRGAAENAALRILTGAAQSEQQLRRRLERRGYGADTAADVVGQLREGGWVDDAGLASGIARRRLERGYGRRRIIADLATRGVGGTVVSDTLGALDSATEEAAVRAAAQRLRHRLPAGRLDQAAMRRLAASLERRGFGYGLIRTALREIDAEDAIDSED